MVNRRDFLGASLAAIGGIFVPQFGRWHRQGSLLVPEYARVTWGQQPTGEWGKVQHVVLYSDDKIIGSYTFDTFDDYYHQQPRWPGLDGQWRSFTLQLS